MTYKLVSILPFPTYFDMPSQIEEGFHKHLFYEHSVLAANKAEDEGECPLCAHAHNLGKKVAMRGGLKSDNPYKEGFDSENWLKGFNSIKVICK